MAEGGFDELRNEEQELEELRRKKLEEMKKRAELERQAQIAAAQRRVALKKILTRRLWRGSTILRWCGPSSPRHLNNNS